MNSVQDRKLYLVRFRHESNPNEVQERFTLYARDEFQRRNPGVIEILEHLDVFEECEERVEQYEIKLIVFDTLPEAEACTIGFEFGAPAESSGFFAEELDDCAVAVLFMDDADELSVQYFDRRTRGSDM